MNTADGWHAVSLSNGIEAGRSAGTQLFGKEIVIWRDNDGVAHAWEDRCPHRGMRLSFGFVRGNHIACLYHGWQYDTAGQCRFIPAHPKLEVPSSIRVATYACEERLGMLWMYSGEAVARPELSVMQREVTPVRSIFVDSDIDTVRAALVPRAQSIGGTDVALLSLDADGLPLLAAIQPYGSDKTALHIVLDGPPAHDRGPQQTAAAIWAEELRRDLEAAGAIVAARNAVHHGAAP